MSNAPAPNQHEQKKQEQRQPIAVERLLITHANPAGVKLPHGDEGKSEKISHTVKAGMEGDIKTEIDLLPGMQSFRVKRTKRVTRSGPNDKEIVEWKPIGQPFYIPQAWACWVPVGE
jgi:hypothetical protein